MGHRRYVPTRAVIRLMNRWRQGFSLAELIVVIALGTVVSMALYRTLVVHQRFYRQQGAVNTTQDALRLAWSVLAADLLEANAGEGDFGFIAPESVQVRSPVGFAIVCDMDNVERTLGLFNVQGRVSVVEGDSLLIYDPAGWVVRKITVENHGGGKPLSCPYAGGPSLQKRIRIDTPAPGVRVGSPIRAFHRYTYKLEREGDSWWLARADGARTEILAGPFSEGSSGLAFAYFDSLGQSTTNAADVARVDLTLVAVSPLASSKRDSLGISAGLRNQ